MVLGVLLDLAFEQPSWPEPTMITFWTYAAWRRPTTRIAARRRKDRQCDQPEHDEPRDRWVRKPGEVCHGQNDHVPIVTTWKTPTMSSTVE